MTSKTTLKWMGDQGTNLGNLENTIWLNVIKLDKINCNKLCSLCSKCFSSSVAIPKLIYMFSNTGKISKYNVIRPNFLRFGQKTVMTRKEKMLESTCGFVFKLEVPVWTHGFNIYIKI